MSHPTGNKTRILLEQAVDSLDVLKAWFTQSWKIGIMMAKGAYLLSERRRLFSKLGEEVYYKVERGEIQNKDLESIVKDLSLLTKKVELEEMLIRSTRFGRKTRPLTKYPSSVNNPRSQDGMENSP